MNTRLAAIIVGLSALCCAGEAVQYPSSGDDADGAAEVEPDRIDAGPQPQRPPFCRIDRQTQVFGAPGTCQPDFRLQAGECTFNYAGTSIESTLCDLEASRCTWPVAACDAGWCLIPPLSFLGGQSPDLDVITGGGEFPGVTSAGRKSVPYGFYVQQTEVTREEFLRVMGYSHPEQIACPSESVGGMLPSKGQCPAAFGSIYEAMRFANALGEEWGLPPCYVLSDCGMKVFSLEEESLEIWTCESSEFRGTACTGLRLPTLLEAELTARAGTKFAFPTGPVAAVEGEIGLGCEPTAHPTRVSWYCANAHALRQGCPRSDGTWPLTCLAPQPVASLEPNPFGVFDSQGNLAEFAQKIYCKAKAPEYNTCAGPMLGGESDLRISVGDIPSLTGGWYLNGATGNCSMCRAALSEGYTNYHLQVMGLRLVRTDSDDCSSLVLPER